MSRRDAILGWLDSRTGLRAGVKHLLDERLPAGVGWWFITGSILLLLLGVQALTGVVLMMYYVPAPEHAYDSIRFIMDGLPLGWLVRGLHVYGASFIVVAAGIHLLRVVLFGSYKRPREVTWMTGVALLLVILGLGLSGYLLPWDQKAYWATTVTINIARNSPLVGEYVVALMRGGHELGALTVGRWYAAHVLVLPAALVTLVIAHLYLMRRHGISGPVVPRAGRTTPFFPAHALKDTAAIAVTFTALVALAILMPAHLDDIANPSDTSYIPRPEWYFLWLFQLLKYFPGPLEPVATMVIPGLVIGGLLLLPFLDRGAARHPLERRVVTGTFAAVVAAIAALTALGLRDTPSRPDPAAWGPMAIAGHELAQDGRCGTCHVAEGPASPLAETRLRREPEWLIAHVEDPEIVAPGIREPPPGGMKEADGRAIMAYLSKVRAGAAPRPVSPEVRAASRVFAARCAKCHTVDGDGDASEGGDISTVGRKRDARWLQQWIADPTAVDPDAEMPAFGDRLTAEEMAAIVNYLAQRK
jgi:ubiquinol-cytochrome c reductase cytochrome b subunit